MGSSTIILFFLFFYFCGEPIAANNPTGAGDCDYSKKVMCHIKGNMQASSPDLVNLEPKDIPPECEVIVYGRARIDENSVLKVDEEYLKSLTELNKPVIVTLSRGNLFSGWVKVLTPDGNTKETNMLCEFAKKHKIQGYILKSLTPQPNEKYNEDVGKYIISYLKQLNCCPDLIIGVAVDPHFLSVLTNERLLNFCEMNDLVTFYYIQTFRLNYCDPKLYNGLTPIGKSNPNAPKNLFIMEDVVTYLKESKIDFTKVSFVVDIIPDDINAKVFSSYSQVCKGKFDCSTWCVQTTKNLYDKGKYVKDLQCGIMVMILDLDDIQNDCECDSPFFGFKNVIAGFTGGSHTPCQKFDVQSMGFPFY
ncbi:unnamed protein product [Aphis gossypii]|uniref:Uncharacterized protein n=1 Tax=Aphis gossypii TaxID=80765 RepID=A0A9P0NQK5_APHGO|nr:unnamed protein product [Aphis gossypii]